MAKTAVRALREKLEVESVSSPDAGDREPNAATRPFDGLPLNVPLHWGVQPPTPDAQRGFKTCASLVGGEEGEAGGGEGIAAINSKQESVNMR